MSIDLTKNAFLNAAKAWICDGYSCDIRFISTHDTKKGEIWEAAIYLNPIAPTQDFSLKIDNDRIIAGHSQLINQSRNDLLKIIEDAISGTIEISGQRLLLLPKESSLHFSSEMNHRDRWFYDLHLYIGGENRSNHSKHDLAMIDNALRSSQTPFDGLDDLSRWLGLQNVTGDVISTCINLRIGPPIDLIVGESSLKDDRLYLVLNAHQTFDISHAGLAIRCFPEAGLSSRRQISAEIHWSEPGNGRKVGIVDLEVKGIEGVEVMLMIQSSTVRRQWLSDPTKARNHRLIAVQSFDKDLKMTRQAVLESPDSGRFENGIAALLFLLGFSPSVQIETDSPDLVVATPSGRLALVECTMRIADFSAKLGKLVDRRGALTRSRSFSR